jgi:hypothetical protein
VCNKKNSFLFVRRLFFAFDTQNGRWVLINLPFMPPSNDGPLNVVYCLEQSLGKFGGSGAEQQVNVAE